MAGDRNSSIIFVVLVLTVTLALLAGVSKNVIRPGSVEGEWGWGYRPTGLSARLLLPIAVFLALTGGLLGLLKSRLFSRSKLWEIASLGILALLGYLLIISMASVVKMGLDEIPLITINEIHTSYFLDAAKIGSMTDFLRTFHLRMPILLCHSKTHPPGPIVFFWLILSFLRRTPVISSFIVKIAVAAHLNVEYIGNSLRTSGVSPSSAVLSSAIVSGFVLPLIATMSVFPIYFLGKRLYDQQIALASSVLFLLVPSMALFSPQMDQLFALLGVTMATVFYYGLKDRNWRHLTISGSLLFIGLFFSLGMLALLFMMLCLFVTVCFVEGAGTQEGNNGTRNVLDIVKAGLGFALGFFVLYFAFLLVFKFNLFRVFAAILVDQRRFNMTQHRTYSTWILYNLDDFFVFIGIPIAMLFFKRAYRFLKDARRRIKGQNDLLLVALIVTLLILDFSGVTRGEVARMWMFLMPFVILVSAPELAALSGIKKKGSSLNNGPLLAILVMQFVSVVVLKMHLSVFRNF